MIPIPHVLFVSVLVFIIGMLGVFLRRNILVVFMGIELMFNAANLAFVGLGRIPPVEAGIVPDGFSIVPFVMAVAAAEAAVGLALVVALYRASGSVDIDVLRSMKG
ncbi:NADH-quinone oxidoreductase subunit NuoK [bacterium]|nr:NADH-quinone oxidoreductase subunit NuoK [bacterium]